MENHTPQKESSEHWWDTMLTRRQMNQQIVSTTALMVMAGVTSSCDDDDEVEAEKSTLELQQKEGWNIGSQDKQLTFPDKQLMDSKNTQNWKNYLSAQQLMDVYQPPAQWQPYHVPTLLQGVQQESLRSTLVPVHSQAMKEAYSRGLGMKELLKESKNQQGTAIVVDISGPEAVAFAAALADVAQPVLIFDNLPHPLGVVPAHVTLGALLYYAQEIAEKKSLRPADAPAIFVLDKNRLTKYTDADNQFDNRYMAKMPTVENLQAQKISNILYAVSNEDQKNESDDINDDFATYQDKGITVSMLALSRFQPQQVQAAATTAANPSSANGQKADTSKALIAQQGNAVQQQPVQQHAAPATTVAYYAPPVYYYGGNPFFSPWFFYHYSCYTYYRPMPAITRLPPSSFSRPTYQAVRRPTMFSSSSVGGSRSAGVGKQRPTGFGFVGVRMSSSRGTVSGVRAGRSGSFGRSSFGGHSS